MSDVGRLQRVPLREVWAHEAFDLHPVAAAERRRPERGARPHPGLGRARAENRDAFSVDLVAEDENGGTVIIENQLGKSDHDHLGKLITYLTAMSARAAIWIVSEPRPEHVAALTWLNEPNAARFYLLKMEAVRIGASPPAPLLTIIVSPSDEVAVVGEVKKDLDERHRARKRWWSMLVGRPEARLHSHITPSMYPSIGTSSGVRGINLNYTLPRTSCGAELYIDRGKGLGPVNRQIFDALHGKKAEIEQSFGGALTWERLDARRACRISCPLEGGYSSPETEWDAKPDATGRGHEPASRRAEAAFRRTARERTGDRRGGGGGRAMTLHREISFENEICAHLAAHGWLCETATRPLRPRPRPLPGRPDRLGAGDAAAGVGGDRADARRGRGGGSPRPGTQADRPARHARRAAPRGRDDRPAPAAEARRVQARARQEPGHPRPLRREPPPRRPQVRYSVANENASTLPSS